MTLRGVGMIPGVDGWPCIWHSHGKSKRSRADPAHALHCVSQRPLKQGSPKRLEQLCKSHAFVAPRPTGTTTEAQRRGRSARPKRCSSSFPFISLTAWADLQILTSQLPRTWARQQPAQTNLSSDLQQGSKLQSCLFITNLHPLGLLMWAVFFAVNIRCSFCERSSLRPHLVKTRSSNLSLLKE